MENSTLAKWYFRRRDQFLTNTGEEEHNEMKWQDDRDQMFKNDWLLYVINFKKWGLSERVPSTSGPEPLKMLFARCEWEEEQPSKLKEVSKRD